MKSDRFKSYALVCVQAISLIVIFLSGSPLAKNPVLLIIEIAGVALGIWALVVMGWRNMNITPTVKAGARLVTEGPYRIIRHPMYAAVLLVAWPLIIGQYSLFRFAAGVILTIDLVLKLFYEESLLKNHFPEYAVYMKTTYRLIPFLF